MKPDIPQRLTALKKTYDRLISNRPDWPKTFDKAMSDPLISRIIKILTDHPNEPKCIPRFIDQKSRAAGERDED